MTPHQWGPLLDVFRESDTPPARLNLSKNQLGTRLDVLTRHIGKTLHFTISPICVSVIISLDHTHMRSLVQALLKMPHLVGLDVGHNKLSGDAFGTLVQGLEQHHHLTHLSADSNNLQALAYRWLNKLDKLGHLQVLKIRDNGFSHRDAQALQQAVSRMPWLTVLDVTGNDPDAFKGFRSQHPLHLYVHGTDRLPA